MLEAHGLNFEPESQLLIGNFPFGGHGFQKFPAPAAAFAALIKGVELGIGEQIRTGRPNDLRVGPKEIHVLPAFEFITVARGDNRIIRPILCYFHKFPVQHVRRRCLRPKAGPKKDIIRHSDLFIISENHSFVKCFAHENKTKKGKIAKIFPSASNKEKRAFSAPFSSVLYERERHFLTVDIHFLGIAVGRAFLYAHGQYVRSERSFV